MRDVDFGVDVDPRRPLRLRGGSEGDLATLDDLQLVERELGSDFPDNADLARDPYNVRGHHLTVSWTYPLLLHPVAWSYGAMKAVNAVVVALTAVPVFLWARRLVSDLSALAADGSGTEYTLTLLAIHKVPVSQLAKGAKKAAAAARAEARRAHIEKHKSPTAFHVPLSAQLTPDTVG